MNRIIVMVGLALVAAAAMAFDFTDATTSNAPWTVTNVTQVEAFLNAIDDCTAGWAVTGAGTNLAPSGCIQFQAQDTDLTDLADGSLSGSKVGTGISATNVTTGTLGVAIPISSGVSGLGTGVATALAVNSGSAGSPGIVFAKGASALDSASLATTVCANVDVSTTGAATTDTVIWNPNGPIDGVTGFSTAITGSVSIQGYAVADNVRFRFCNPTSGTLDPGSITVNWKIIR